MAKYIANIDGGIFNLEMTEAHKAYKEASIMKTFWTSFQIGEITPNGVKWGSVHYNPNKQLARCNKQVNKHVFIKILTYCALFATLLLIYR